MGPISINFDDYIIIFLGFIASCWFTIVGFVMSVRFFWFFFDFETFENKTCLSHNNPILLELSCENKLFFFIVSIVHYLVAHIHFKMGIFILSAINNMWWLLLLLLSSTFGAIFCHIIWFYFTTCAFCSLSLRSNRPFFSPFDFVFAHFTILKYQILLYKILVFDFSLSFCSVTFHHINFTISLMRLIWWWVDATCNVCIFFAKQHAEKSYMENICVLTCMHTRYFRLFYHFALERFFS